MDEQPVIYENDPPPIASGDPVSIIIKADNSTTPYKIEKGGLIFTPKSCIFGVTAATDSGFNWLKQIDFITHDGSEYRGLF